MLGYMNPEALDKTIESAKSPSSRALNSDCGPKAKRRQLPQRSKYYAGLRQRHVTVAANPIGPTCHKGTSSCFGDTVTSGCSCINWNNYSPNANLPPGNLLHRQTVCQRHQTHCAEVGEEGVETALAATVHDRFEPPTRRLI